jgi:hypothetical protein
MGKNDEFHAQKVATTTSITTTTITIIISTSSPSHLVF